ncbi:uncharacterized protein LOC131737084 isoform X2 [Acipenser ruthenus]|uniref:uncharacterized protein LOC131737084 isoform X2 n=1 Tax=Acipenser ruthenus TaxID=7906 RepID=UPI0027427AA4|nr:uncharacterized protein LOC131737084 isoform X2 [Acipenser ruthenus]
MSSKGKKNNCKFSFSELDILITGVTNYYHKLFGKGRSYTTSIERSAFWTEMTHKVNSVSNVKRSRKQVRHRWDDLKRVLVRRIVKQGTPPGVNAVFEELKKTKTNNDRRLNKTDASFDVSCAVEEYPYPAAGNTTTAIPHYDIEWENRSESESDETVAGVQKRRTCKFSDFELDTLVTEISNNYKALFGEERSVTCLSERTRIWSQITEKVNSVSAIRRSEKQVKHRWDDLKRRSTCLLNLKKHPKVKTANVEMNIIERRVVAIVYPECLPLLDELGSAESNTQNEFPEEVLADDEPDKVEESHTGPIIIVQPHESSLLEDFTPRIVGPPFSLAPCSLSQDQHMEQGHPPLLDEALQDKKEPHHYIYSGETNETVVSHVSEGNQVTNTGLSELSNQVALLANQIGQLTNQVGDLGRIMMQRNNSEQFQMEQMTVNQNISATLSLLTAVIASGAFSTARVVSDSSTQTVSPIATTCKDPECQTSPTVE